MPPSMSPVLVLGGPPPPMLNLANMGLIA